MKLLTSARNRWLLLAALWVVLLVLGIGGFLQQASDADLHRTFLDNLYLTLQLAALDYGGGDEALNWRLQVARFAAPVMAASTVLLTASLVFVEQYRQFRLRFVSGHTIVCGLGETGTRIAQAFAASGATVVAIESDAVVAGGRRSEGEQHHRRGRRCNGPGDTADGPRRTRCSTGVRRRRRRREPADLDRRCRPAAVRHRTRLRCTVHLADADLASFLSSVDLDASKQIRVTFFNVHERAARTLVAENPPFVDDGTANHIVVMGLGQLGRNLVIALAQAWADRPGDEPLPITLVDRVASGRWEAMCMQHPALREVCAPTVFDFDLGAPRADDVERLQAGGARAATDVGLHGVRGRVAGALDSAVGTTRVGYQRRADRRAHTHRVGPRRADPRPHVGGAGATCESSRSSNARAPLPPSTQGSASSWRVRCTSSTWRTPPTPLARRICAGRGTSSPTTNAIPADDASMA